MAFKVFTLLINGLAPVIPAWFITNSQPEAAIIKPWPIVWTLLGVNVLLILIAWKHLGYTRRQRETEALMLIVNAFVPFGNLQRTVSGRNTLFVFHANAAVLLHAGCLDCLD